MIALFKFIEIIEEESLKEMNISSEYIIEN
jgi:hypothetical protein